MATLLREAQADACMKVLQAHTDVVMSAATLTEALIVANGRGVADDMAAFIYDLSLRIEPVTAAFARRAASAYARWGRGVHPAALNFGDCFAYALARSRGEPLLFKGDDFSKTDVKAAL